ncbi:putative multidrug export ATP-binding/permease protein [Clostridium botulinum A1 str. CFSAN002368]|nr:putative multidrug export ATP-binding/permease protein [Clostridium botulinum A1 str. CFSAN002368]
MEYVQGISVVKAFNMDENTNKKIDQAIKEVEREIFYWKKPLFLILFYSSWY